MYLKPFRQQPARQVLFCTSALFLVHVAVAGATDDTVPSGTTENTTQIITDTGDTLTVEDGATIDTTATGSDGAAATAHEQTVNNAGTINGGEDGLFSRGSGDTIHNRTTGTITGNDDALQSDGDSVVIINDGLLEGNSGIRSNGNNASITNNNEIKAVEDGIVSEGDKVSITNDGSIFSDGDGIETRGRRASIDNQGLIVSEDDGLDLEGHRATATNSGTIRAVSDGILAEGKGSIISNSGTIHGEDDGIQTIGALARITNSGVVTGDDNAVDIGGDDSVLNIQAGSVLDGGISISGSGFILNIGNGLNLYLDYDGTIGTLNAGIPVVHDETNGVVYTVDPTGFALAQAFLQTMADAVHGAVRDGAGRGNAFGGGFSGTRTHAFGIGEPGYAETGPRGWVSGFGGYQSQNGTGAVTGANQAYGGVVSGGGIALEDRIYGALLGGSYSRLETDNDTQVIDAASYYGGLYGGTRSGAYWISASIMGGYSDFSSDRTVAVGRQKSC